MRQGTRRAKGDYWLKTLPPVIAVFSSELGKFLPYLPLIESISCSQIVIYELENLTPGNAVCKESLTEPIFFPIVFNCFKIRFC